jgi:hypothetical protein
MKTFNGLLVLVAMAAPNLGFLNAAELKPATCSAWRAYLQTADARMRARLGEDAHFLWTDEAAGRDATLRGGSILVSPGTGNGTQAVPGGLIHDWIAAMFIPHANLAGVLRVAHDYADYKQFYKPAIVDSKLLGSAGGEGSFEMRSLHRVLFVTAVMDSQFATYDFSVDGKRWYIVADATRVQEIENYGQADERILPPDQGKGYVWRLHNITRYEERDGGVYVEMETIALSREVPVAVRWMVNPVVARFSRSELMTSLQKTREAVTAALSPVQHVNDSVAEISQAVGAGGGQQ